MVPNMSLISGVLIRHLVQFYTSVNLNVISVDAFRMFTLAGVAALF